MHKSDEQNATVSADDYLAISQFIYRETDLLDCRDWHQWLDLFTEDGLYWAPAAPEQLDGLNHVSLIFDDTLLRRVRVARYETPYAFSLQPFPRSSHLVSNIIVESDTASEIVVTARFIMAEYQRENPIFYAGSYRYCLIKKDGSFKIREKKAELINCDGPLPSSHIYF